jgi:hypothetical protein
MELTLEEMELEQTEYLPPREVMGYCYYNPCCCRPKVEFELELSICL